MKARVVIVGCLAAVGLAVTAVAGLRYQFGDSSTSGTGLRYDGRFYWASGLEVRNAVLGGVIAEDVPFQDTTADLRQIAGLSAEVTVAALLPSLNGSPGGLRWTLISTDQGRGTNPEGYPDTRAVLVDGP